MQANSFIQNPANSQNYNRFSYVLNNPLKYVDPSGYVALNPWYETLINGMRFFKEYPEMGETFKDKNDNLWKLKKDMKFSDENGNVFLRMIGDGLYVEIAKYQEYQEKLQHYNSQFENADFGFIAGAGVFRVEGEGNGINQGVDFSLAKMYLHFQIGGGKPLIIKTNTIDFKNATQKKLGLSGIQKGDVKQVNLFDLEVNSTSLAFGKIDMKYLGDNKFSIMPNYFDFNIEWEAGYSSRNVGTVIGGSINYNLMINPAAAIVPLIFGGPYEVIFYGTITIPE
ncbi:MAG: hypothetical protein PHY85_10620 [Bacteroidales bacterium]|nr:hypothetical protein [Bacteroidales bacterium]